HAVRRAADAPQIFDMSLDPSQRAVAREKALTGRMHSAPNTYAPGDLDNLTPVADGASVAEVRVLGAFAQQVRELEPAAALDGNQAASAELRIVTGTVLTIGDAIAHIGSSRTYRAQGLRGGSVSGVVVSPMRSGGGSGSRDVRTVT